jgi:hypothetical protein
MNARSLSPISRAVALTLSAKTLMLFGARILSHNQSETAHDRFVRRETAQPIPMVSLSNSAWVTRILPLRMVERGVLLGQISLGVGA